MAIPGTKKPAKRKYNQQPNIITRSITNMGTIERRIMYQVINQMNTSVKDGRWNVQKDLFENMEFVVPYSSLAGSNHKDIKEALKKLATRVIIPHETDSDITIFVPFGYIKAEGGVARLTMLSNIVPAFIELSAGFTKYDLSSAMSLSSIYSQKLYELLSHKNQEKKSQPKWEVPLIELQAVLNASSYRYVDFKRYCLDMACNEINEKTELAVRYEAEKTGKAVSLIKFFITKANSTTKQLQAQKAEVSDMASGELVVNVIKLLSYYEFSQEQRTAIQSDRNLSELFIEIDHKITSKVVMVNGNETVYMTACLFPKNTKG